MADGFTLDIDSDLAALIERRAKEAGAPLEQIARQALQQALFRYDDYEWLNGDPREPTKALDPDDTGTEWSVVKERLNAKFERLLKDR